MERQLAAVRQHDSTGDRKPETKAGGLIHVPGDVAAQSFARELGAKFGISGANNNVNFGGGYVEDRGERFTVRATNVPSAQARKDN